MLRPLREVKKAGWDALVEKLGYADAILLTLEYEDGYGDYTRDRRKLLKNKRLSSIVKEIENHGNCSRK